MDLWKKVRMNYSESDLRAFNDLARVAEHFRLPLVPPSRIFSRFLDGEGCVRAPMRRMRRSGAFAHLFAFREFAASEEEIWIWNERYWFSTAPAPVACMVRPQQIFQEKFGLEQLKRIGEAATRRGLFQTCKTGPGLPDLAVFVPGGDRPWRFVEIKMPGRGDGLSDEQRRWLELLTEVLGSESVIELELVPTGLA